MVEAQAMDNTTMAMLSGTGVAKWPPSQAPNCESSAPVPIWKESHRARCGCLRLSGRTLMAPAAEFDHHEGVGEHHQHLGAEQPGRRLIEAGDAPQQVEQAAEELQREPEPDQFLQRMARREAHTAQVADQKGEPGGGKPRGRIRRLERPICVTNEIGVRRRRKTKNDLRGQHLAQHIADKGAAGDQLPTSPRNPPSSVRSRRVSGSASAMLVATRMDAAVMA